jgi:hypothetical protein
MLCLIYHGTRDSFVLKYTYTQLFNYLELFMNFVSKLYGGKALPMDSYSLATKTIQFIFGTEMLHKQCMHRLSRLSCLDHHLLDVVHDLLVLCRSLTLFACHWCCCVARVGGIASNKGHATPLLQPTQASEAMQS